MGISGTWGHPALVLGRTGPVYRTLVAAVPVTTPIENAARNSSRGRAADWILRRSSAGLSCSRWPDLSEPKVDDLDRLDEAVDSIAGSDVEERAQARVAIMQDLIVRAAVAREGLVRADHLAHAAAVTSGLGDQYRRPPPRPSYPRYGWRQAVEFAVRRQMFTPAHLAGYRRLFAHRLRAAARGQRIEFQGMVFTGRRVELQAGPHGRMVLGPWCWIGDGNRLRVHEGQLRLGAKVVVGRDNVVNTWLDILIGDACILADWIYICDFDHRFDRLDMPIKDQGIVTSPVRIGPDCWIGEKATVLRGVDIGRGSVIGSHAVVCDDIPPFSIAVGVPARPVRSRLPAGMDGDEAAALLDRGLPLPGDPLDLE